MVDVAKFYKYQLSEDHLNSETLINKTLDLGRYHERIAVFRPTSPLHFFLGLFVGWAA